MYWSTPICRYKVLFLSYLFTTTTAASSALSTFEFQSGWTTVSSANSFIWNFLFPFSESTLFRIIEIVSTINHYHICFPTPVSCCLSCRSPESITQNQSPRTITARHATSLVSCTCKLLSSTLPPHLASMLHTLMASILNQYTWFTVNVVASY